MAGSLLSFDTSEYERHDISSFIYEPVMNEDGSPRDFRILYASDVFARDWLAIYHNENYLGALLRDSTLMDDYSLKLMERFITEEPYPFVTYMPMVNLHLYFEPIYGLPAPYAGFYLTNITNYASRDAKEHFFRNIRQMKNNSVLIQKHDNGRFEPVFVSEDFAKMMECSIFQAKTMISGMGFYKTTVAEDRPLVRSMMERRVAYDGSSILTIRKITAKRNTVWCNVHYAFIDDFGESYIYCTYNDVTALKEHEERLRSTYSSLGNNFYQLSNKTLSNMRVDLTKNSFEEIKGNDLFDTDSPSHSYSEAVRLRAAHFPISSERAQFLKLFDKERLKSGYLEGVTNVSQILYSIRSDGRACFVNISAAITRHPLNGDVVAFITERECNSEKVKDTLTDKILAEKFDMVAYLVDGQYGVTIGEAAKVKHGSIFPTSNHGDYSSYLDNQIFPVLSGDDEQKSEAIKALSLETVGKQLKIKEPYIVNIAIEMGGEIYYKQFDFYSIDPEAQFYILLKSDTTKIQKEHMTLNEHLRMALEAANQANAAKTSFLSSMSHEIRTPMNAIIGLNNIALKDPELPDRIRGYLEKIDASTHHLLKLINDILDMSRIESGRMTLKNEEFSFSEMLEQINTMIDSQCQEHGLNYKCRVSGHVHEHYIGDVMKLKQVLINTLGNAVKFTAAPGEVSFLVEQIAEFEGQSTLRFVIKDTGAGMDEKYLPKIFDAFSQENENQAHKSGSTGLGMAITKNIVDLMNGDISVTSEKGVGTEFTVTITLRSSEHKSAALENFKPHEIKALIIDEDSFSREHAAAVMLEVGISADTADSGKTAIEMIQLNSARREAYNLIVADSKLDDKNSLELIREIRDIIGTGTAVIIMTAYSWDDIKENAYEAGVDSFMSKPLFASSVISVFRNVMDLRNNTVKDRPKAELTGRRILLAEDLFINAEIVKQLLGMKGMLVEHAENGQMAVDKFLKSERGYYDAVLMDVRMPVLDGLGAAKAIRSLNRTDAKSIPIIAMTANAFDEDVQLSLQAGMNAHLSKPVDPERLFETLGELIYDSSEVSD
ncbi:MAG: response regulator [Ruminococcus sp.]|nr:response regulator [Ruminococcus sp.]